jgi:hypothetical protein
LSSVATAVLMIGVTLDEIMAKAFLSAVPQWQQSRRNPYAIPLCFYRAGTIHCKKRPRPMGGIG